MTSDQQGRGFLLDPDGTFNAGCQTTESLVAHHSGPLILCGTPGAGKSAEARKLVDHIAASEPETAILTLRHEEIHSGEALRLPDEPVWKSAREEGRELVVVVDGFDQVRLESGVPVAVLAKMLRGHDLSRVRLIITCRASDWSPSEGAHLLGLWGKSNAECVFELCPLRRRDVRLAAETMGLEDPEAFVLELLRRNLEAHAHWPLSLGALLRAFKMGRVLPTSSHEIFGQTVDLLLGSKDGELHGSRSLRRLAERVSALLVLGGRQGIVRQPTEAGKWLSLDEVRGDSGTCNEVVPATNEAFEVDAEAIEELRRTGLFVPIQSLEGDSDQTVFGLIHHSMAEFLAASYLGSLSIRQLSQVLTVTTGGVVKVPPQLAETSVWVAAEKEEWFEYLLKCDPEVLLRIDGAQITDGQKARLATRLLTRAADESASAFKEVKRLTPSFGFPGLGGILRTVIRDGSANPLARRLALRIAEQCRLAELSEDIWALLNNLDESDLSRWAGNALDAILLGRELAPNWIERLESLAASEIGPDEDDELKGHALLMLVPKYKSPAEVAELLTPRKDDSFLGSYAIFLGFHLPDSLGVDDLPAYLEAAIARRWGSDEDASDRRLLRKILSMTLERLECPQIRSLFVRLVLSRCGLDGGFLFSENDENLDVEPRLELLRMVVDEGEWSADEAWSVTRALNCRPRLPWLLSCLRTSPIHRVGIWATIIGQNIRNEEERESCLLELLDCYARCSELRNVLPPLWDGCNIHETLIAKRREGEVRFAALDAERKQRGGMSSSRREILDSDLVRWREGHSDAWLGMGRLLLLDDAANYLQSTDFSIPSSGAWTTLDADERESIRNLARAFLIQFDDPARLDSEWHRTRGSEAGYLAVDLLHGEIEADPELSAAVGGKWIRAFLREGWNVDGRKKEQAALLYRLNRNWVLEVLREKLRIEDEANCNCQCVDPFDDCWDDGTSSVLADYLRSKPIQPQTCRTAFAKLMGRNRKLGLEIAREWLDAYEPSGENEESPTDRVKLFCAALLTDGTLWSRTASFLQPSDFAKTVFLENSWCLRYGEDPALDQFDPDVLANVYVTFATVFYDEQAWEKGLKVRSWSARDSVDEFLCVLESAIARRSSETKLLALRKRLPDYRRRAFAFAVAEARSQGAREEWKPMEPLHLLRMVRSRQACFIRNQDELMDFILERLREYGTDWEENIRPLWNEPGPRNAKKTAKHEDVLSNKLHRWLREAASTMVVNREVQKIEIMPKRLDLHIEFISEGRILDLVIEVKKAENSKAQESLQTQLVDRYLLKGKCSHGIYLVAWLGDKPSKLGGTTPKADAVNLNKLRRKLKGASGLRVETLILDCRFRSF